MIDNKNADECVEYIGAFRPCFTKSRCSYQFSNQSLNQQVFLQRIEGEHTLNQGSVAELLCLSTNAHIALKQFIGCQVAVDQVTDTGQFFRTTGIITEASQGQSDGSLTIYNLTLKTQLHSGINAVIVACL